jgi:hypothetical protein
MPDEQSDRYGPRRSDPGHASAARINDYMLGGSYNYPVDRAAAEGVKQIFPYAQEMARYNRQWLTRAVTYLASECGVHQFLDIGSGIPTQGNVHQIAPDARVVYADYERVAVDIGLDILVDRPYATSIHADVRQPDTILDAPATVDTLDFDQPMAMIWSSMIHFIEDQDEPLKIFARYRDRLKPGDYIALTHVSLHFATGDLERQVRASLDAYNGSVAETLTPRTLETINQLFTGTTIIDPGIVPLPDWRADPGYEPDPGDIARVMIVGGVGRIV